MRISALAQHVHVQVRVNLFVVCNHIFCKHAYHSLPFICCRKLQNNYQNNYPYIYVYAIVNIDDQRKRERLCIPKKRYDTIISQCVFAYENHSTIVPCILSYRSVYPT